MEAFLSAEDLVKLGVNRYANGTVCTNKFAKILRQQNRRRAYQVDGNEIRYQYGGPFSKLKWYGKCKGSQESYWEKIAANDTVTVGMSPTERNTLGLVASEEFRDQTSIFAVVACQRCFQNDSSYNTAQPSSLKFSGMCYSFLHTE
jgi:hypothetical protein